MITRSAEHTSFVLERQLKATPAREGTAEGLDRLVEMVDGVAGA